ncbi:MAG TPA: peptide chain release factor 1 [Gemmatimonadaceae bacterium]|nr:peptide chain release factor 1 [Gemmatimonadaceae bacterium]
MSLRDRLRDALERASEVERELSDPQKVRDQQLMAALGRELRHLQPLVQMGTRLQRYEHELAETRELADSDDAEMAQEASAEEARLQKSIDELLDEIKPALIPHDPLDDRPAIVEIRGGAGGDEAAIFAADLYRMYTRFAEGRRWRVEVISQSDGTLGGVKEAIFKVKGDGAFGAMRWESGVHRVQRVPVTESQGRIHTSAATVAVLPEAEEIDLKIEDKDLRIDVFRSSGPGGQSVNTTDSAVRITHIPSGIVVSQQDQKSQLQNKIKAMEVLRARLLDAKIAEQEAARARMRKTQVGTGDRSAKIRTYNYPQNRVTDHRINLTLHELTKVLNGEIEPFIEALKVADIEERLGE